MRKFSLSFVVVSLISVSAFAAEVKITSFARAGQNTYAAELCGKVLGLERAAHLQVIVDHNTSKPGTYNVHAEKDGNFCVTVVTYAGTAKVVMVPSATAESADKATLSMKGRLRVQ